MIIRTTSMTVPVTVTVLMKMMMTLKDRAVNGTGNGHLCEVSFCFLAGMISLSCKCTNTLMEPFKQIIHSQGYKSQKAASNEAIAYVQALW